MESVNLNRPTLFAVLAGLCAGLFIIGSLVLGGPVPAPSPQLPADISGPDRYLTEVSTDKPIYRTGEKLYVRGVVLHAEGHTPVSSTNPSYIEIRGPKGDTVASGISAIADSVIGFSWNIPASQAGGEYTVRVSNPFTGDAPAERKFDIRAYRAPRLKSQIVFVRDGYGPGDTVAANLHVDRAEGGIPAGAKVSVTARVDGEETWKGETTVDASGNASASFKLPTAITRGEGTIAMVIQDGGTVETAGKTIPILLQTLDLGIYPEGGDLVAGLPNRVYVEGRTPAQKPADMAGIVVNSAGKEVALFRTEHEGRGRFSFTPAKGEAYSLRVTEPAGIKTIFPLPAVQDSGVVISSTSDVTPRQRSVVLRVAATVSGEYGVSLSQRGKELSSTLVSLKANQPSEVTFTVPKSLDGVIIATVYDDHKMPRAERLLFRQPERNIRIHIAPDSPDYIPGDRVVLRITTTDDNDKPVGALVGLTVTDSSVLEMIEKREQAPRLPVMVLLENDVKNLSDAHVYLDESNPKAPLATDLLLGTQGWRRFATVNITNFLAANGDAARRALAVKMLTDADRAKAASLSPQVFQNAPRGGGAGPGAGGAIGQGQGQGQGRGANGGVPGGVVGGVVAGLPGGAPPPPPAVPAPPPPAPPAARGAAASVGEVLEADKVRVLPLVANNVLDLLTVLPEFRQQANQQGLAAGGARGAAGRGGPAVRNDFVVVREYSHTLRPNWTAGSRSDFAETIYWNAGIKTDATTGVANVSFSLSDSVTSFKVLADGFASDGTLGSSNTDIESVQPFFIEPKLPLQVTSGDRIQLPVSIVNGMNRELAGVRLSGVSAALIFGLPDEYNTTLRAKERTRRLWEMEVANEFSGTTDLVLDASAGPYRDTVTRKLDIQPLGFPFENSKGGVLESNGSSSFEFSLPVETLRGSITASVVVYPTPLASMTEALQALLRQPNGCFEQTSSTSYPMVMAQQYFITHAGIDPGIVEKAKTLLDASYKRLTGFESPKKGYEWFGADPGHEALTAYGLMQFTDMSRVRDVDKEMIQRTRAWLLARRDGNGGFNRSAKALDSFGGAPQDTTDAYITWALVESGEQGLEKEIAHVKATASSTQDSYIVALAANILNATGDKAGARLLMEKLAKNQDIAGNVKSAVASITRSGGDALAIETTALSALAWISEPAYTGNLEKAVRWIVESNKNGRFASTQSTILALRAIVAYDAARARPKAAGRIILSVDGKDLGSPNAFSANTQGAIVIPVFGTDLGVGKHTMALRMEDGSSMPFSMSVKYFSTLPDNSPKSQIGIEVSLKDRQVQEGGITEARVSVVNKSNQAIPTPVAIVGIPGGLEVRHDQLKELVKSGKIDAYEVIGREVVLYWRYMKANDKVDLPLSLVAAVPGVYTGPASRAYLYYTDEFKNWAPGLKVTISPR